MDSSKVTVPEYDEELNHVFFTKKNVWDEFSTMDKGELKKYFYVMYKTFVENRQNLINELRNIADESVRVKRNCHISTITGSSIGIAGGAAAIIGAASFPPLLVGGLIVTGLATASNLGTQLAEFIIFRNMVKKVESLSKYDIELVQDIESIYQNVLASELLEEAKQSNENSRVVDTATNDLPSLGLQLGAGGTKSVTALGLRTVGIEIVKVGGSVMRGIAQGAIGIGVVIDGVTIFFSSRDLSSGCSTKFSEAVYNLASLKEEELGQIMAKIDKTDLLLDN